LNHFLAKNVAAAKKHAIDLFSIKYQKSVLFNQLYNIVNDCVLVDQQKIREKKSSIFEDEIKLQESVTVMQVKSFPFSSAAKGASQ